MIGTGTLLALATMSAVGQPASVVTGREQQLVEAVARMAIGEEKAASVASYFRKDATFAKGDQKTAWDSNAFQKMVQSQCGRRWSYWSQDRVLFGIADDSAAELRRKGHPEGPGVTFYCKTHSNFVGYAMYTFKFKKGVIAEVRELFFVQPPAPPPPSVGGVR